MADKTCIIRTRKFMNNPLLKRKQMIIDVLHQGRANVSKVELSEKLAKMYKVSDGTTIVLFGFRTAFGGGKSTGFGLIYDDATWAKKFEPKYRLRRISGEKNEREGRKMRKDKKNRAKTKKGKERVKILYGK